MTHAARGFSLAASLVLISSLAGVQSAKAQSTPSTAAHIYIQIQGPAGAVYGFNASSTGQLSAISGAPSKPAGQIVGSTPSKFFTLGDENLHSYSLTSNGAIGSQFGQVPVLDYAGGNCGSGASGGDGAALDHTGKFIYVMLQNGSNNCAAYQTYAITSAGYFDFTGDTEKTWTSEEAGNYTGFGLPSITGNESFAYSDYDYINAGAVITGFQRESSGTLELIQFHETDPTLNGDYYSANIPDASPAGNYVVLQLHPADGGSTQLGSYTVDSQGNITSTNTSANMPTTSFINPGTTFSPSGKLFVAYANGTKTNGKSGIEIYNFNGAAPLSLFKTVLTGTPIDQVAWDSSNHMYAISKSAGKLYVFTVTSTSMTQDATWSIGSPFKMIVVSTSSGTGGSATQYSDPLINQSGTATTVGGQVTIDTGGNTTVKVTSQEADTTYTLQFCPAFVGGNSAPACFNVTTVSTDSSGNGNSKVMFPKSGDWAGEFLVNNSGGTAVIASGLFPNVNNETYLSTLLPESKTNGGVITTSKTQDSLSSGSVSYSNNTLLFTVNGATPSTNYQIDETEGPAIYSSNTYAIGSFTTNDSGNGSESVDLATASSGDGDMFNIEGGSGAGFIGGFSIP